MQMTVEPASGPLEGTLRVPGDKSLSHRAVLFSAMAEGTSRPSGVLDADDVRSSMDAVRALGARVEVTGTGQDGSLELEIEGWGDRGPTAPDGPVYCGNSGTTARLLMGILAGWPGLDVTLTGDDSLARRPMRRVTEPLTRMGARFEDDDGRLPVTVHGGRMRPWDFRLKMASAQVKTAIMLAATRAEGFTIVQEPARSRDHTELMLPAYGVRVDVSADRLSCRVEGVKTLDAADIHVPGDPSSAAFWAVGAAMIPGSRVTVEGMLLNTTRAAFIRVLGRMGAPTEIVPTGSAGYESVGDLRVLGAKTLLPVMVAADEVPSLVDEVPVLAVAAAVARGKSRFEGVGELRLKESDRLAAIADGLTALGVVVRDGNDWFEVDGTGGAPLRGAELESLGDHRLAMAWAIAALAADGPVTIDGFEACSVSYPRFADDLASLRTGA
jgi:3-phosphoshikimate 1-carboxyvinyltransferase